MLLVHCLPMFILSNCSARCITKSPRSTISRIPGCMAPLEGHFPSLHTFETMFHQELRSESGPIIPGAPRHAGSVDGPPGW
ncbi:hypothetical protein BDP27DRAFT_1338336 [Rhodocollybia butyracea]|uniref:Secreted protein n=1 Tax=Rhodocollybia butyracea TaxID=206335 RepID=A0A9P5P9A2_9AGAR|nr:hypothetical protein BDP27DRAFT_1338336 [Rhodocollybia butyracea]